jgi:hypothetical protein
MADINIYNPYNQRLQPKFGIPDSLPENISNYYSRQKGNKLFSKDPFIQFIPEVDSPTTINKDGISFNQQPPKLPSEYIGIKYPQYSTSSHALIETQRNGEQLAMPDLSSDNPYKNWTVGIQYYSVYEGDNLKTRIPPILYPQAWRKEVWAQDNVNFPQINSRSTMDITPMSMDYSCKNCDIASASLGTPVLYQPQNSLAPLPVQNPGIYPNIGRYTSGETFGTNIRDIPQPVNAIIELQKRKAGYPATYIPSDRDSYTDKIVRMGIDIT